VASCGATKKEAVAGLKTPSKPNIKYMISENRENEVYHPVLL
jgi:hypothetical protein